MKEVSLDVNDREYFVILGRTGSGKTMLLESIAGFHKHSGTVSYRDRDISRLPTEKRNIGFVYQDFALFPHLSVVKNIRFSERYQKNRTDSHWDELIEFLDLGHLLDRNIRFLSGGEKQRVALARAIHSRPDILLLDEPLSAIDPSFRDSIMENLKGLNHRFNITVVHVTHNFREAAYLADKIGIMINGKLEQQGPAQTVLQHPDTIGIAKFLGFKNILPDRLINTAPEGGNFALNPSRITISKEKLATDHNITARCLEVRESTNHFKLLFEADGCNIFIKNARQIHDPALIQAGVTLNLSFSESALTRFKKSEGFDEASV